MTVEPVVFHPIGTVRSPFTRPTGTPIQPRAGEGVEGTVELLPGHAPGLRDLEGFSHVMLLCHLHLAGPARMEVVPYLDDRVRGVFATRSPSRPNAIGLSVVRLLAVEGNVLRVRDLDLVEGTPVLDVKPYVPAFDEGEGANPVVGRPWPTGSHPPCRRSSLGPAPPPKSDKLYRVCHPCA